MFNGIELFSSPDDVKANFSKEARKRSLGQLPSIAAEDVPFYTPISEEVSKKVEETLMKQWGPSLLMSLVLPIVISGIMLFGFWMVTKRKKA